VLLPAGCAALLTGTLDAQVPDLGVGGAELPRFTLHEIVIQRNNANLRIPGPWLRAAHAAVPASLAGQNYSAAAARLGMAPLQGSVLAAERSQHVMGLFRRRELVDVCRRTLEQIRSAIPADTTRARFDRIFGPPNGPVVDLHDAALAWVRARVPGFRWSAARPALIATHWVDPSDTTIDQAIPRAIYSLAVLARTDSAGFAAARSAIARADSASAAAVFALLQGYAASEQWYSDALQFLLTERWLPEAGGRSIRDLVQAEWRLASGSTLEVAPPTIQARWFGYPQAVPHYGVPPRLFAHLVRPDNAAAIELLARRGQSAVLRSLRWLPPGDSNLVLLQTGSDTLRLSTVSRQAKESLNGFLEPEDAIAIDPGYSPLLAVGAVVHEWQHLLFRQRQLDRRAARLSGRPAVIGLPEVEPHIAEGFAEWSTERILDSLVQRWPLLGFGELEKLAGLVQTASDDQHALGYAMVRALAAALPDPASTTQVLLRYADAPANIMREPPLREAWRKYRRGAALEPTQSPIQTLMPEITFTIEDGLPDVISTRILLPLPDAPSR
jgi:hypothetical protein